MASGEEQYAYDAILFHREDKRDEAECLCTKIYNYGVKTGRPLRISTFDSFCSPAKQETQNFDDAVEQAKYIICMEDFYDESFKNNFFADAALQEKRKRKQFIVLKPDQPVETKHLARDSLQGCRMISDTEFYANEKEKLVKELTGRSMTQCTSSLNKDTEPSTRTHSSSVTKHGEHTVLHNEVEEDAHPDNTPYYGSPPVRGGHDAEGQHLAEKSAHSKQWGTNRNTKNPKQVDYTSDTVILHTDDETSLAQSFSEDLQEHAKQTGRNLRVQLYSMVLHPGKQKIRNLEDTLMCTKNIICSPEYYRENQFDANVALEFKREEARCFLLFVETKEDTSTLFKSMEGFQITHNWQFVNEGARDKLVSILCGVDGDVTPEDAAGNEYPCSLSSLTNSAGSLSLSSQSSSGDSSLTERKVVNETSLSSTALLSSSQRDDSDTRQEGNAGDTNNSTHSSNTDSLPGSNLITDSLLQYLPTEINDLQRSASALVGFLETPGRDESRERTMETSGVLTADGATPSRFPSGMQHDPVGRRQIPDGASTRMIAIVTPLRNIASTPNEQPEVMRNVDDGDGHHAEQVLRIPSATEEQHIPNITDDQRELLRNYNGGEGIL